MARQLPPDLASQPASHPGRQHLLARQSSALARLFSALRHRDYRIFFFGHFLSLIGTWMQTLAQSWLVLQLTDSPFLLGLVGALQFAPVLVLGLFAGVLADKLPKRRLLLTTQSLALLQAAALGLLTWSGLVRIEHILLLAALLGMVNAFDMPARQSMVVELVGRDDLVNAIALNSSIFNAARILGPALGGALVGRIGIAPLFLLNAASFLPLILGLLVVRGARRSAARESTSAWADLREGLAFVWRRPVTRGLLLLMAGVGTFAINFNVVVPLVAHDILATDAAGLGFLMAAMGIGSLMAALHTAYGGRGSTRVLFASATALCLLEVLLAASRWPLLSAALLAASGYSMIRMAALANSTLQLTTPHRLRGRVMSVYTTIFAGSTPVGNLLLGSLASSHGASLAIGSLSALALALALVMWRFGPSEQDVARAEAHAQ